MENGTIMKDIEQKVVETGTELVTQVAKEGGIMKKVGIGTGLAIAGAVVYKGAEMLYKKVIKPKTKKRKNEKDTVQPETSEVETEFVEE